MNRRGASLLVAAATVTAIGLLGAIALAAARLERIVARQSLAGAAASWAAQAGMARVLGQWDSLLPESLPVGSGASAGITVLDPATRSRDSILRLGQHLFEILVSGERRDADTMVMARERQSLLVMLLRPQPPDSAAAWTSGPVRLTGFATLSGHDAVPAGWDSLCSAPGPTGTGIRAQPGSAVDTGGCASPGCLSGQPAVLGDTAAEGQAHLAVLRSLWPSIDTLVGGTVTGAGPVAAGAVCAVASGLNWGAPESPGHPCFSHFRVVGARSGTVIRGGIGQGVLLGAGDLVLDGDFRFYGVVASPGTVRLRGRSEVIGTVLAGGSGSDSLLLEAQARVARSSCAVHRALAGTLRPITIGARGWAADP